MSAIIDDKGNITLVQGDSCVYGVTGLPIDKNYTAHFEVRDNKRKTVGQQITVATNYSTYIEFVLLGEFTDLLTVKKDEDTAEYYFSIKLCSKNPDREETLLINDNQIGDENTITVYPKKVEGI